MSDPLKIIMDGFTIIVARCFDAVYDGGIDIMRIKVAVQCACIWIIHLWNILCLGWFCTLGIFDVTAFDAPVLQYPTLRIFFGYLTFGIFLGYFVSWIFYWLYLLFILRNSIFFFYFSFITSYSLEYFGGFFFLVPLLFKIDLIVKGPSLVPYVSCYFYFTMPEHIFSNILHTSS